MEVCQPLTKVANDSCPAIDQLQQKLTILRQSNNPIQHFEDHENEIHSLFVQAEREILAEELQKLDINEAAIEVNEVVYHQALRSYQTYQSAAGPVRVLRSLYRNAGDKCIVPLELKAGVVEGHWLPKPAKQAAWLVAQLPPADVKSLLDLMGNMMPSTNSLARLPKKLSEQWEQRLESFETLLAENLTVPPNAVTVAVSLDGVMLPMKDGKRQEKREKSVADGKRTRGPAGCQEASCGTLSFYDDQGDRLSTIRYSSFGFYPLTD